MHVGDAPNKAAGERLARSFHRAARTHERALLVELWAAEFFTGRGETESAQRHRGAAEREAALAEECYARLSDGRSSASQTARGA